MTRWIPVPLTARHLETGERHMCFLCPVALALNEATGNEWQVLEHCAWMMDATPAQSWRFPPRVRHLIRRIDAGEVVDPCTLRLPRRFARWMKEERTP